LALKVILAANLRKYVPEYDPASGFPVEIPPGTSVRDLSNHLGIPQEEVKLIMVNGLHADWDVKLQGDERVALFPPVGGG
jgi:sulfur carrier protein ThiS